MFLLLKLLVLVLQVVDAAMLNRPLRRSMFGIGLPEFILIMALALIVVGPDKLPGLAKTVAKQILELKQAANSLKDSLQDELAEEKESLKELTTTLDDVDVSLADLASANTAKEEEISSGEADDEGAIKKAEEAAPAQDAQPAAEQSERDDPAPKA
ncbi:MAG: twin-arginine translocase TatA/TatE family subunit [Thermodesulfobacteriota bacterium]